MPEPSLIESVRVRNGCAPLWRHHVSRLVASSAALGFPVPEPAEPAGAADGAVRIIWDGRALRYGERPVGSAAPLHLVTAPLVHRPYPHKTTDRRIFDAAVEHARAAGADDAILLTEAGEVAEAAVWGLYWWDRDRLCAPAASLGILPSVARRRIEEIAGAPGERRRGPAGLAGLGLFAANAVRGVVLVATLAGETVHRARGVKARTEALAAAFWP